MSYDGLASTAAKPPAGPVMTPNSDPYIHIYTHRVKPMHTHRYIYIYMNIYICIRLFACVFDNRSWRPSFISKCWWLRKAKFHFKMCGVTETLHLCINLYIRSYITLLSNPLVPQPKCIFRRIYQRTIFLRIDTYRVYYIGSHRIHDTSISIDLSNEISLSI